MVNDSGICIIRQGELPEHLIHNLLCGTVKMKSTDRIFLFYLPFYWSPRMLKISTTSHLYLRPQISVHRTFIFLSFLYYKQKWIVSLEKTAFMVYYININEYPLLIAGDRRNSQSRIIEL